jgi:FkbM family methyltransferase
MKNYSQNGEQEVIEKYFGDFVGTFADIGANDGVTLSNTYSLALKKWKGVLIEASPKAFLRLAKNYQFMGGCEIHHVALGEKTGEIVLNESSNLIGLDDVALVSTVHAEEMKRFESAVSYEKVEVHCATWLDFLQASAFKQFDFISMDIEGSELEVLPSMDLTHTKMICIEWNGKPELKVEYEKYFDGFKLIHENGENLIYAR